MASNPRILDQARHNDFVFIVSMFYFIEGWIFLNPLGFYDIKEYINHVLVMK
jgi:hypothetical protein